MRRREARAEHADSTPNQTRSWPRWWMAVVPVLLIVATLALVGALGISASQGIDKKQVQREVTALLAGVPQKGPTLGSPQAPITVQIFADLECPTVHTFVVSYLPDLIDKWVRDGSLNLELRSLETDTLIERTFFRQEAAALAAGSQNKMWDYVLTFVHEQGEQFTGYATNDYLADIASQVPGLDRPRWQRDRQDALLQEHVALAVHSAHAHGLRFTPSFLLRVNGNQLERAASAPDTAPLKGAIERSMGHVVALLKQDPSGDNPVFQSAELEDRKEVKELASE
jgi:protein-disulfide isomerase